MDFSDRLRAIASRIPAQLPHLQTEEATKHALVMPFIQALGFEIFNPLEVVPEFTADVGTKKGEKVDYAIMREGSPIMLFECKKVGVNLGEVQASQLFRYFTVTEARLGILTNGVDYKFYSDLESPNKMDEKPFLEFSLSELTEPVIAELKRFTKPSFDVNDMISAAIELKYTRGIKRILAQELREPSDELVRLLAKQVYSGNLVQQVRDQFRGIVQRAFAQFINDRINERLQHALASEGGAAPPPPSASATSQDSPDLPEGVVAIDGDIITTQDELDAFNIIRAILREEVDVSRIAMRDGKSYCSVLFDDNNRKPIARLRFLKTKLVLGIFDSEKIETRVNIDSIDEIFEHAGAIKTVVHGYLSD